MNNLTVLTTEIIEEVKELTQVAMKECLSMDALISTSSEEFQMMQKCMSLLDKTMNLAVMQAEVMDEINGKLDILLAKKDEA